MRKMIIIFTWGIIYMLLFVGCTGDDLKAGQTNMIEGFVCPKVPVVRFCKNPENIVEGDKVIERCQWIYDNCPDLIYAR